MLTSEPNKPIKHIIEIGAKKPLDKGSSGHILCAYNNLPIKDKQFILKNEEIFFSKHNVFCLK